MDGAFHASLSPSAPTKVSGDEKAFFDLVGPALAGESVTFRHRERCYAYGPPSDDAVVVVIENPEFFRRVLTQGNLGLGESYMEHQFEVEHGTLERFLMALARSDIEQAVRDNPRQVARLASIRVKNLFRGRMANVQSHYDLGEDLFAAFLDDSLAYSCGYQRSSSDTLAELQVNKFDRICQKLSLVPGERLLDIGCGFGGLLIHAARHYGVQCVGITISRHHHRRGREIVEAQGLSGQIDIRFATHEQIPEQFDKIVSVGMMEHLSRRDYPVYIRNIKRSLTEGGAGLIHCIGCNNFRNRHDPFIQKYIFPGSGQPRLSEMALFLEKNALSILDVENMAQHYAPTLRGWQENFANNYHRLDHRKYDDRFRRMWEYYLACGIAAATASDSALYQVLFMNSRRIERFYKRV
jgi:cyclopropane-fatty-acyl-phospholipid synthase